jgi:hypothetical protein
MATALSRRSRLHTLNALMAAAAALSACGGGSDDDAIAAPAPPPPAVAPSPPPSAAVTLPSITGAPQGASLDEGAVTTLVVSASDGGGTLSYQWFLDDQPIAGATTDRVVTAPMPFSLTGGVSRAYKVRVTNSAGSVDSAVATITSSGLTRSWQDQANLDPYDGNRQASDSDGAVATVTTASGRVFVLGVVKDVVGVGTSALMATAVSADNADDLARWNGANSVLATAGTDAEIDHVAVAASASGHLLAVYSIHFNNPSQGEAASQVRAMLYTPDADPTLPGRWDDLGNLTDASFHTDAAAVASTASGEFEVVWLQQQANSTVNDLVARRYSVPAAGQVLVSGWGAREPVEANSTSVEGVPIIVGSQGKSLVFYLDSNGNPAFQRYQYNVRNAGASWDPAGVINADLPAIDRTRPVHAVNDAGMVALVTRNALGRAYVRRFNLTTGAFADSTWDYRANAYGSDPSVLIDAAGRIDVFGVSVNTNAGNSSVLAQWTFDPGPGGGWGSASVLRSDSRDFNFGFGITQPKAGRDAAGNVVLAWSQPVGNLQALQSLRYSALSQGWASSPAEVMPVSGGPVPGTDLQLAVSPSGAATLAWKYALSGNKMILRARLR